MCDDTIHHDLDWITCNPLSYPGTSHMTPTAESTVQNTQESHSAEYSTKIKKNLIFLLFKITCFE